MSSIGTTAAVNMAPALAEEKELRDRAKATVDAMEMGVPEPPPPAPEVQQTPQAVTDYLARNQTQRDIARAGSEDPLDAMASRVRVERQTQHYQERERAIREVLAKGVQNVGDPTTRKLASEFVMSYPDAYRQIRGEMQGGAAPVAAPPQTPEQRKQALAAAGSAMADIVAKDLEAKMGRQLTERERKIVDDLQSGRYRDKDERRALSSELGAFAGDNEFARYIDRRLDAEAASERGDFAARSSESQRRNIFSNLSESEQEPYLQAARASLGEDYDPESGLPDEVERKAAQLYYENRLKAAGLDRESRLARRSDVSRSRAIRSIASRHGGDPSQLRRAMDNWNSRNPDNPILPEDFGLAPAGQNVSARPGQVVEVDDVRSVNPRNISSGSILVDASGAFRSARRKDGSLYGQPVLQDRNSGFYFPDPDKYGSQSQFDGAMSRQDRVNMRQAIMQSGNSVMAGEQRRLVAAREAAASSIPEIRDAGLAEVNELERALHYRYATEAANLMGPASGMMRDEIELGRPTSRPERAERPITMGDVEKRLAEIMDISNIEARDLRQRFGAMTQQQREEEVFRMLEQARQPYVSGGGRAPTPAAAGASPLASGRATPPRISSGPMDSAQAAGALAENMDALLAFVAERFKETPGMPGSVSRDALSRQSQMIRQELLESGIPTQRIESALMQVETAIAQQLGL